MLVHPLWFPGRVDYRDVLKLLGQDKVNYLSSKRFYRFGPISTVPNCQLCSNGTLSVYPDLRGGVWLHCPDCKFGGDVLTYTSKLWGLPLETTLKKLEILGCPVTGDMLNPEKVRYYHEFVTEPYDRICKFWQDSLKFDYTESAELRYLYELFGLTQHVDPARWAKQVGRYVGWGNRLPIEAAYRPNACRPKETHLFELRWNAPIAGRDRVFVGVSWNCVLMIPFYDLPGRLTGFMMGGRKGKYPTDWVFRRARSALEFFPNVQAAENGIGFYDAALTTDHKFGTTVFVVQDPILALKLHSSWFKDHGSLLPLVLAQDNHQGKSLSAFNNIPKKDWVFWAAKPDKSVISQAMFANGRIVFSDCDKRITCPYKDILWLHKLRDQARPWAEVLFELGDKLKPNEMEEIVLNLPVREHMSNHVTNFLSDFWLKSTTAYSKHVWRDKVMQIHRSTKSTGHKEVAFISSVKSDRNSLPS